MQTPLERRPGMLSCAPWLAASLACALLLPATGQAAPSAEALASSSGCMACHGLIHKQVGPGFAQVAERYRNNSQAPAELVAKVRAGGVGNWGRVIMPRQAQLTPDQAKQLVDWILSQPAPR